MNWIKKNLVWIIVNIICLLPMVSVVSIFRVDFSGEGQFITAVAPEMPQREGQEMQGQAPPQVRQRSALGYPIHSTGEWSIRWLVACLTITPLSILFGWKKILRYRKVFGLFAFGYSALHILFFIADKNFFAIFDEFNFILGLIAGLIMFVLAITSNKWSMRRLKKNWKKVQRFAYASGVLTVLHMLLLNKDSWMLYGIIMGVGFILRIPAVKKFFADMRSKSKSEVKVPELEESTILS